MEGELRKRLTSRSILLPAALLEEASIKVGISWSTELGGGNYLSREDLAARAHERRRRGCAHVVSEKGREHRWQR